MGIFGRQGRRVAIPYSTLSSPSSSSSSTFESTFPSLRNLKVGPSRLRLYLIVLLVPTLGSIFYLLSPVTSPAYLENPAIPQRSSAVSSSWRLSHTAEAEQALDEDEPKLEPSSRWAVLPYVDRWLGQLKSTTTGTTSRRIPPEHRRLPMSDFLDRYFPDRRARLWMTLADVNFATASTAHLALFVDRMNLRSIQAGGDGVQTKLLVVCSDDGCLDICDARGWTCYEGYRYNRPEIMLEHTWPKLRGAIDILSTGRDMYFVDSDVFFRENPYPHMPDPQSSDLQIQEDVLVHAVNTGWWHMRSTPATIALWQAVLNRDLSAVSRDQANFNDLLGSSDIRKPTIHPNGTIERVKVFEAAGVKVRVLDPEKFRAFHFEWLEPGMDKAGSVVLHTTCTGNWFYKSYIAGSYGYWQNLDGYYSQPTNVVTTHAIHGTAAEVLQQWKILLFVARATGRALMPPLEGYITDKGRRPLPPAYVKTGAGGAPVADSSELDGRQAYDPHDNSWLQSPGQAKTRYIWSIFPMGSVELDHGVRLVEPGYAGRAAAYAPRGDLAGEPSSEAWNWATESEQDIRVFDTPEDLARRVRSAYWKDRKVLRLTGWQYEGSWRTWYFREKLTRPRKPSVKKGSSAEADAEWDEWQARSDDFEWRWETRKGHVWDAKTCDLDRWPTCNKLCWTK